MAYTNPQSRLGRQWAIIRLLQQNSQGVLRQSLLTQLEVGKSTLHRDLVDLEALGAPIRRELVDGEALYMLENSRLPALKLNGAQWAALSLIREQLAPFEGTQIADAFDRMLLHAGQRPPGCAPEAEVAVRRTVSAAISQRRRLSILYLKHREPQPETRTLEPLRWLVVAGGLQLEAFDHLRGENRTFIASRIRDATMLDEPAPHTPESEVTFGASSMVSTLPPVDVVIKLSAMVVGHAFEAPIGPDQVVTPLPDRGGLLRGRCAGPLNALKWVLAWGEHAEVLEPPELRDAVRAELASALRRYADSATT